MPGVIVSISSATLQTLLVVGIGITLLVLLVLVLMLFQAPPSREPKPAPEPELPVDPGAASIEGLGWAEYLNGTAFTRDGKSSPSQCTGPTVTLVGNKCECEPPFFGPTCTRPAHDNRYYGLGLIPEPRKVDYEVIPVGDALPLSFNDDGTYNPNSCTGRCEANEACVGVEYNPVGGVVLNRGSCALITTPPQVGRNGTLITDPTVEPKVYLKHGVNPRFLNRVFAYSGIRPLRWWNDVPQILPNTVQSFTSLPTRVVNESKLTGVWSLTPFSPEEFPEMLRRNDVYIDRPSRGGDYALNLPSSFAGQPVFVMYSGLPSSLVAWN